MLQLVSKEQAKKLRKLGFNLKVRDLYVIKTIKIYLADRMEVEENWNKFNYTLSRPTVVEALQWIRVKYPCKCEIVIPDWDANNYAGQFRCLNEKIIMTRVFSDRYKAESELLNTVLHRITKRL